MRFNVPEIVAISRALCQQPSRIPAKTPTRLSPAADRSGARRGPVRDSQLTGHVADMFKIDEFDPTETSNLINAEAG